MPDGRQFKNRVISLVLCIDSLERSLKVAAAC